MNGSKDQSFWENFKGVKEDSKQLQSQLIWSTLRFWKQIPHSQTTIWDYAASWTKFILHTLCPLHVHLHHAAAEAGLSELCCSQLLGVREWTATQKKNGSHINLKSCTSCHWNTLSFSHTLCQDKLSTLLWLAELTNTQHIQVPLLVKPKKYALRWVGIQAPIRK